MTRVPLLAVVVLALFATAGCSSILPRDLPEEAPPLVDMEEPLELQEEPDDEAARKALPLGGFTGVEVRGAHTSLDELDAMDGPSAVRVVRVVENSPGDAAGLREGDLLERVRDAAGKDHFLDWPSAWKKVQRDAKGGDELVVTFDRAGARGTATITVTPRVRAEGREEAERFREEKRWGVVLRTATEVEAHAAGLGPGGGAVIVGLSRRSPLRAAGLRYGDLLVEIDGASVEHPQVVLDAIRDAAADATLALGFLRDGTIWDADVPVSERASEVTEMSVPLLFSYERDRGASETSILLGLIRQRTTEAAWEWRLFWLFRLSGGDADRLVGEETP